MLGREAWSGGNNLGQTRHHLFSRPFDIQSSCALLSNTVCWAASSTSCPVGWHVLSSFWEMLHLYQRSEDEFKTVVYRETGIWIQTFLLNTSECFSLRFLLTSLCSHKKQRKKEVHQSFSVIFIIFSVHNDKNKSICCSHPYLFYCFLYSKFHIYILLLCLAYFIFLPEVVYVSASFITDCV